LFILGGYFYLNQNQEPSREKCFISGGQGLLTPLPLIYKSTGELVIYDPSLKEIRKPSTPEKWLYKSEGCN